MIGRSLSKYPARFPYALRCRIAERIQLTFPQSGHWLPVPWNDLWQRRHVATGSVAS